MSPQEIMHQVIYDYCRSDDLLEDDEIRHRCVDRIFEELAIDDYKIVKVVK